MTGDQIALLPAELLETEAERVQEFRALSATLRIPLGWHYLLDLPWASRMVESDIGPGTSVLDAGAGYGLLQWWLARRGAHVLSVDRLVRDPSRRLREAVHVRGLREGDLPPLRPGIDRLLRLARTRGPHSSRTRAAAGVIRDAIRGEPDSTVAPGRIVFHRSALDDLAEVPSESVEAVVSISALEHNSPELMEPIVRELMRVLRPGGKLVATLSASAAEDWFHEPSGGWCYTEATLRRIFDLRDAPASNFHDWTLLFSQLRASDELRNGLAAAYFRSERNGMPGGRWDPQYQPVGVVKIKST